MPFVQYVVTALQCQVEDFPAMVNVEGAEPRAFKRSCEGALHVRPGSNAEITADELAHLREKHPKLAAHIRVLVEDEALAASRAAPTEPPPAPNSDGGGEDDDGKTSKQTPEAKKKLGTR